PRQLARGGPQLASGTWLPQSKAVIDFQLTDTSGRAFTRRDLTGAPTLVFFGFTHCPDGRPTTLLKRAQVRSRAAVRGLRELYVSVQSQCDTPPVLGPYVH